MIEWSASALLDTLTLGSDPVVMVRFEGYDPTDLGLREMAAVTFVLGLADDPTLRAGHGVQAQTNDLLDDLDGIAGCFPKLSTVGVDYAWDEVTGGPDLVAVHITCVGEWA
ncbi:MAG: hypothetical protein OXM88_09315 [bacterium]|nr:hypothetical protein [bacterium]